MSPAASCAGAVPGRSQIENWDIDHLETSATRWRASVCEFEELFAQHRQKVNAPGGTEWEGTAKDAALDRVTADTAVVGRHGEIVRSAADLADTSIGDLRAAQRAAITAIIEAEADGFRVGEDLSVTDTRRIDIATMADRYTAAAEHAENIHWNASQLLATDTLIGQRLISKAAELNGTRFDGEGTIQAASFGAGFKQSPFDDLLTKEQALAAWEKLQADIASYNSRCAVHLVGPLPPPQYAACQQELAFLQGQEAALRARLADFGIHPGEGPFGTAAGGDLTSIANQIGAEVAAIPSGTGVSQTQTLAERVTALHLNQADAARVTDIASRRAFGETLGVVKLPDGSNIVLPTALWMRKAMRINPDGSVTVFEGDLTQFTPYLGR
ncbi:hypothetical protein A5731_16040 [Mycolicibacterium conceptionense]|uniref:Uncharacterized protein n=2 Tax=Mycolicibacterium TaxID=1866885 RepID=A0A1A1ZW63_9MYCO|nr:MULTISPECIES: hypothetical protein [Mycolicibacterium]MCW1821882.1 hypothetical protein [Mycolicibacterium senegalense]OBB06102.1 hypothetical protein A5718_20530 [Mycolicibacterium conceptionense]OBF02235.1 hypothetical protein A5731_16040 [Mycolicibacterium conceptionense]OBF20253.1 hypothetical protein A5726_16110 [Mycolicibacterium conceptionense]OBF47977.1 hypothetical protein A5720_02735 [Mycolicibacterium conceptionense]